MSKYTESKVYCLTLRFNFMQMSTDARTVSLLWNYAAPWVSRRTVCASRQDKYTPETIVRWLRSSRLSTLSETLTSSQPSIVNQAQRLFERRELVRRTSEVQMFISGVHRSRQIQKMRYERRCSIARPPIVLDKEIRNHVECRFQREDSFGRQHSRAVGSSSPNSIPAR